MEDLKDWRSNADGVPDVVDKLEVYSPDTVKKQSLSRFSLFDFLWILWKLPVMYSTDLGRLGPGFGCGVGFGFGIGFGIIGGAGIGFGLPGLQFGFGFGAGFGFGVGFGYGIGKGLAYDEHGKHCNLPRWDFRKRAKNLVTLEELHLPAVRALPLVEKEDSASLWDQFLQNSNLAFDFLDENNKKHKHVD
ncbi:hypothetical protein KP509_02G050300 [Ceratopteris richardii]|uniref:Uncharacterized protein n=1 Tax=Ceratopteris richardii TaxID=49495 RepID=A0A8T2VDF0_CERRI|nr:hypothetical protein KP509_02G050300 [Ceratopteris richardii]